MKYEPIKYVHSNHVYRLTPTCLGLYVLSDPKNYDPTLNSISFLRTHSYDETTSTLTIEKETHSYFDDTLFIQSVQKDPIIGDNSPTGYAYEDRKFALDNVLIRKNLASDEVEVNQNGLNADLEVIENTGTIAGTRMLNYYPECVKAVKDISAVVEIVGRELDHARAREALLSNDAFLCWMGEDRIAEWEKALGVRRMADDTLEMRRNVILAKIRGQNKFNETSINEIVRTITGFDADVTLANNVITVTVKPSDGSKTFNEDALIRELQIKTPAHMRLVVARFYSTWGEVNERETSWKKIYDSYLDWNTVMNVIYQ